MILTIDPNISTHSMTWKDVKILCEKNNIEFKNQSFAGLIKQLQDTFLIPNLSDINLHQMKGLNYIMI